jgi:predicted dehydrogenase
MKPNLSRRQFLAHSASIAAAPLGIGVGRAALGEGAGARPVVRLGIIGAGDRGRQLLLAAQRAGSPGSGPEVRVAAVCDLHPRHLKQALELAGAGAASGAERPRGATAWQSLLDDPGIDAVVIATPVHQHAAQATTALLAGKHVYCEKPLGLDPSEAKQVLTEALAAEARGQVFQAGFQRRYSPRYRRSLEHIHSGDAGRPLFVRAQWHAAGNPPRDKPWLFRSEKSGGLVVEQACHQLDVCNWLFGATPVRASGFGGIGKFVDDPPGRNVPDHSGLVLEYPGGATVQLSHVTFAIPDRRFGGIYELVFTESSGIDLGNAIAWTQDGASRQLLTPPPSGERAAPVPTDTELAMHGFAAAIAGGPRPLADARSAHDATLAALLCQRALESGRVVPWSEIQPT